MEEDRLTLTMRLSTARISAEKHEERCNEIIAECGGAESSRSSTGRIQAEIEEKLTSSRKVCPRCTHLSSSPLLVAYHVLTVLRPWRCSPASSRTHHDDA